MTWWLWPEYAGAIAAAALIIWAAARPPKDPDD